MISVGVISAFIVYAKQFSRPINEIAQIYGQVQTAIAGAERVFTLLDEADEDKSGEPPAAEEGAAVSFLSAGPSRAAGFQPRGGVGKGSGAGGRHRQRKNHRGQSADAVL